MDKKIKEALLMFMRQTLHHLHPNLNEYPLKDIEDIDIYEGDESPKLQEISEHIVSAYYMQKAINYFERNV
jgi:hypothetical protein